MALNLLLTYITNKSLFYLQDSIVFRRKFRPLKLAYGPLTIFSLFLDCFSCPAIRQVPSEVGLCVFPLSPEGFLAHLCLTGDTREACPATLPMTHHRLRYPFCGHPQGPVFTSVVGFITLFWFDFSCICLPQLDYKLLEEYGSRTVHRAFHT